MQPKIGDIFRYKWEGKWKYWIIVSFTSTQNVKVKEIKYSQLYDFTIPLIKHHWQYTGNSNKIWSILYES